MAFSRLDLDKVVHQIGIRSCGRMGVSYVRNLEQILEFSSSTSRAESALQSIDATDPHILVSPRYVDSPVDPRMRGTVG